MPPLVAPHKIDQALAKVKDQSSFIQRLLIDALNWKIPEQVKQIEDIGYGWSQEELRLEGLDAKLVDGQIWQLQPLQGDQPWGIFLLEFKRPEAFVTGRGMTGPLRQILRRLVPSRRKAAGQKSWKREHLLFFCTHQYQHYRVAYFKSPPGKPAAAPLAAFGWGPDVPRRTACEFNLPALAWPDTGAAPADWVAQWAAAFDVEKVTKDFYKNYAAAFEEVEAFIGQQARLKSAEDLRMFTQTLFNRLMFLRFIERKGWLDFQGDTNYLRALFQAGGLAGKSLYQSRLKPLFFQGLSVEGQQQQKAIGSVPFLNGGLFEENELDRQAKDVPDKALQPMVGGEGLFYRYNFTIEESTPLDIEVAVDPEMLGKVFEELVTGRHESGSYYTPRPVVSFMCREALKGYLGGKTKAPAEAVAALVDSQDAGRLKETQAREILAALDDLKAVDPACGSGAYLLGLMQELVGIYRQLYSDKLVRDARSLYDLKLRIISQNLYGVDIDPFATNIAQLRLWLSLAVEADEPVPLPNLDFKIETGDSLLAPDPQELPDLFRSRLQQSADSLVLVKRQYFLAHGEQKESYRRTILTLEKDLREALHEELGPGVVDWRIQFAEAFANKRGGFDMVLANPPYVSAVAHAATQENVRGMLRRLYPLLRGAFDIYAAFLLRGLSICNSSGTYAWIVPNKILVADYAKRVLSYLKSNGLYASIDVSHHDVFENTGVYPVILLGRRPAESFGEFQVTTLADLRIDRLTPRITVREFESFRSFGVLAASGTTGFQAKAILPYISEQPTPKSIPFVVSGCIDRFSISFENVRYMGHRFAKAYIRKHDGLADSKWKFWSAEKIVIAGMTKVIEAAYWRDPLALGVGVYAIHEYGGFDPRFLVGILNSRFLSYFLNIRFKDKHLAGGYLAINKSTIEELPLVPVSPAAQEEVAVLADKVFAAKCNATAIDTGPLERKIDQLVYGLYSLSEVEIRSVDEFFDASTTDDGLRRRSKRR